MLDLRDHHDSTRIRPDDLADAYRTRDRLDHSFNHVDLKALVEDVGESLYGILVQPEDIPAFVSAYPADELDRTNLLLTHTHAFGSKFDIRSIVDGQVMTQVNFGSVPHDARVLDFRPEIGTERSIFTMR